MSKIPMENIKNVIKSCETVQFCTNGLYKYPETRTIANFINRDRELDDNLTLYFLTNIKTNKIKQIRNNDKICLYYFNPETRRAMTLFGKAEEIKDKNIRNSFWRNEWSDFGYEGIDDEYYTIMKVIPKIYKYYTGKMEEHTGNL